MIVHFLRHGESVSNAEPGRDLPDEAGDRLTDRGHAQAAQAARNLGDLGIDRLWSSPLRRARETAEPIAAELGLEIEIREDLRELREADGHGELPAEEQRLRRWSAWMADHPDEPAFAPPGGESFAAVLERVERLKRDLLAGARAARARRQPRHPPALLLRPQLPRARLRPGQVPRMWQLRTLNCALSAFQHRPLDAEAAYPSPGEWLCVTWMARPWDPL